MQKIHVDLDKDSYDIHIEHNCLTQVGNLIKEVYKGEKVFIITDRNVDEIYGAILEENLRDNGFEFEKYVLVPGEKSKSFSTYEDICDCLSEAGITRSDMIIAFGGGVVGDIGGFAAATFLRGVDFVQIPTTLLAQVDSSVGGKVAINLKSGKNLVGNFYQPKMVVIDPNLLKTLSDKTFNDGMAEVIKYGCIRDQKMFAELEKCYGRQDVMDNIEGYIYTCCGIKSIVVANDEKEKGERMLLNFGHTLGHGIEKYFNYEGYTHGEAVAIGMVRITEVSERLGYTGSGTAERLKILLNNLKINYCFPEMDKENFDKTIMLDKKAASGNMSIILLKDIGKAEIVKIKRVDIKNYY